MWWSTVKVRINVGTVYLSVITRKVDRMNSSATTTMTFVNSKSLPFLFFLLLVLLSCILVSTAVDVVKDNDSSSSSSNGLELGQGGGEVEEDEVVDDSSPPAVDYSGYAKCRSKN